VLWYASESWTLAKKSELALDAFERKVLRRIIGPMKENKAWRIRYNKSYITNLTSQVYQILLN
jgi:hypothetical protein